ncbi:hypothetical protein MRB53_005200 [Persea americana]|uniref:Uncharacterized protein n=1 Tax=Persea americana TaxID=3435 RepID=A0ACC2MCE4_PERAE|nr:hypothetical protein MRB53_005200 [Persea americana]
MTVKGGTSQACAACKYQRRKCITDCPLAPYFPPDQPKQFQNAHRLFGVSNIVKILKQLDNTSQKMEAMRSIVCQANIREQHPVHGCLGIICSLQVLIHQTQQELDAVNAQLAICREQHHQISSPPPPPSSQLQLAPASVNNSLTLFQNHHQNQPFNALNDNATGVSIATHHHFLNNVKTESSNSNHNINQFDQVLPQYSYPRSYNNSMVGQSQFIPAQPLTLQQQATVATHGFDEMSTFLDGIEDDRQSSVESKESSYESSLKDTTQSMERVMENSLKSSPAFLPLTSVN